MEANYFQYKPRKLKTYRTYFLRHINASRNKSNEIICMTYSAVVILTTSSSI